MHVPATASQPAWAVLVISFCVASLAQVSDSMPLPAFGQVEIQDATASSSCCKDGFCGFDDSVARMAAVRARQAAYDADLAQRHVTNAQLNAIAQTALTNRLEELAKLRADSDKIVEETCSAANEAAQSADEAETKFSDIANTNNEMKATYGEVVSQQGSVAASKSHAQSFSSQAQIAGTGSSSLSGYAARVGPVCEGVTTECATIRDHATTAATELQAIDASTAKVSAAVRYSPMCTIYVPI